MKMFLILEAELYRITKEKPLKTKDLSKWLMYSVLGWRWTSVLVVLTDGAMFIVFIKQTVPLLASTVKPVCIMSKIKTPTLLVYVCHENERI